MSWLLIVWYVGRNDLQKRIEKLHQHRSDCVHGKVPFSLLREHGEIGVDDAARFEYLAESIARTTLAYALRNSSKFNEFADRKILEDAWDKGRP